MFAEPIDRDMLACQHLLACGCDVEPLGAVHLREALHLSRVRRPLDFEAVADERGWIEFGFRREEMDLLPASLAKGTQAKQRPIDRQPDLLLHFTQGSSFRCLAFVDRPLGDLPRSIILVAPERPAGVYEQKAEFGVLMPVK